VTRGAFEKLRGGGYILKEHRLQEALLRNLCYGILAIESLLRNLCYGIFHAKSLTRAEALLRTQSSDSISSREPDCTGAGKEDGQCVFEINELQPTPKPIPSSFGIIWPITHLGQVLLGGGIVNQQRTREHAGVEGESVAAD
jgi:hypothetical protein